MLWRALQHVENGFYIDVGANSPDIHSVTKAFYDRGWRGINVEPVAEWFEELENNRPRDVNLNLGAGARKGNLKFYEILGTGLSTSVKKNADDAREQGHEVKEIKVPIARLTTICEQYAQPDIHFLKIDVEGAEKEVLTGMDFSQFRPWVLLIESNLPNSTEENKQEWEEIVLASNYVFAYADGLNRFYVAKEHSELIDVFQYPPNVFDEYIQSIHYEAELIAQKAKAELSEVKEEAACLKEQVKEEAACLKEQVKEAAARVTSAEMNVMQAEAERHKVINSRIWRMTAPLRFVGNRVKWIMRGGIAWLTFKPNSRPRRTLKQILLHLRNWVFLRPQVKARILQVLNRFPRLKAWFRRLHYANSLYATSTNKGGADFSSDLTPRAHQILGDLEKAIAIHKQSKG